MSSNLLSLGGWYILPNLVTGWVQSAYYAIWIRAGEPKPQPGTPNFARDRKRIQILVILAYLLYTIYEADWQLQQAGDFYRDLGVSHDVNDRALQSRFRRLTVTHHPDKISSAEARPTAELFYVHLKLCRDILVDPAKRFAYDRFGPDILQWRHCTTIPDFIQTGLRNTLLYYSGTGAVLALLGLVGYLQQAAFWRYYALISLFLLELHLTTRPTFPLLLTSYLNPLLTTLTSRPPYLPFQALLLARKLVLTFFIALSQIGPLLASPASSATADASPQQFKRLDANLAAADQELARLLGLEVAPFAAEEGALRALSAAMRRWLVENTVRANVEVRSAVGSVLRRRREGAPPGAN